MMKCNELLLKTSCLNKADANEPVFVLRAKDPAAAVRLWAAMAHGIHESEKILEAQYLADAMEQWRGELNTPVCAQVPSQSPAHLRR